jgi:hypothetical protein
LTTRPLLAFAAVTLAFGQNTSGVDPRPSVADYRVHAGNEAVSVGAVFLAGADQHKILGEDWSGSYLIVEVSLYPEPGHPLTVAPRDFMLRAGTESVAPVDAEALVPYPRTKTNSGPVGPDSKVHVRTVDTIGVASGPYGRKTVYTDSQVQVAVGDTPYPSQPPPPPDPKLEKRRALEDKELPDAKTAKPIAGYLYFPKPKKVAKDTSYELAYYGDAGKLNLTLGRKP